MANTKGGLLTKTAEQKPVQAGAQLALGALIKTDSVKKRFEEMLGKRSAAYLSSVMSVVTNDKMLQKCTPQSVLSAASIAASLDLPVVPSLGRAWIIPFGNKASFIIGVRGLIELAIRSQQYRKINVVSVCEGEIDKWDKFEERATFGEQKSEAVVGYYAFFELLNGFKKSVYWSKEKVMAHAKRFSKTYGNGPWQTDFDRMAEKTVLADMLRKWGPLSVEMQDALDNDIDIRSEFNPDVDDETVEATEVEVEVMPEGNYPAGQNVKMADGRVVDEKTGELFEGEEFSAEDIAEAEK